LKKTGDVSHQIKQEHKNRTNFREIIGTIMQSIEKSEQKIDRKY